MSGSIAARPSRTFSSGGPGHDVGAEQGRPAEAHPVPFEGLGQGLLFRPLQELDLAHLAQVQAQGVVGAAGVVLLGGRGFLGGEFVGRRAGHVGERVDGKVVLLVVVLVVLVVGFVFAERRGFLVRHATGLRGRAHGGLAGLCSPAHRRVSRSLARRPANASDRIPYSHCPEGGAGTTTGDALPVPRDRGRWLPQSPASGPGGARHDFLLSWVPRPDGSGRRTWGERFPTTIRGIPDPQPISGAGSGSARFVVVIDGDSKRKKGSQLRHAVPSQSLRQPLPQSLPTSIPVRSTCLSR